MELSASLERHSRRISLIRVASVIDQRAFIAPLALIKSAGRFGVRLDDLAGLHPDEFIGDAFEQRSLMRDHENCFAGVAHAREQADHFAGGMNVDVGERLIEQQNFRIVQDRAGQRHALAHALRILADGARQLRIEPDGAQSLARSARRRRCRKVGRSSAGSPCRSSRRRAATDAPCSRSRGRQPADSYRESKSFPAWDAPVRRGRAAAWSSLPRCRRGWRRTCRRRIRR